MTLINIEGSYGSGKTTFAVVMATKSKYPIYTNMTNLKLPDTHFLTPETLIELNEGSLIILDEAYAWLESRLSGGREINQYLSYILFQSRKRKMDFILTDQLITTVDVRFRMLTDYHVLCERVGDKGFQYRIIKMNRYKQSTVNDLFLPWNMAEKIFPLYNTWEKIDPIDKEMIYKVSTDKTKFLTEINKHADDIMKLTDETKKITLRVVQAYCIDNGIYKNFAQDIYNKIKLKTLV